MYKTPILFIIYRNSEVTRRVFEIIKKIKPEKLYISADGPKIDSCKTVLNDIEQTRLVTEYINWDCKIKRRYLDTNMGCKHGVTSAINWFFKYEDEGIILEYDCLADLSFFYYCDELLNKYRNNFNIFSISGNNFDFLTLDKSLEINKNSYTFSNLSKIWGWATWKRAWIKFDINMVDFPDFKKENKINHLILGKKNQKYWIQKIEDVYNGNNTTTWGFIWLFTLLNNKAFCITPKVNLVSNIGFGSSATHAKDESSIFSNIKNGEVVNINHPNIIESDYISDYVFTTYLRKSEFKNELIVKIKKNIPKWVVQFYKRCR